MSARYSGNAREHWSSSQGSSALRSPSSTVTQAAARTPGDPQRHKANSVRMRMILLGLIAGVILLIAASQFSS